MMPGGRMSPKQMKAMMRRMGITQEDLPDVEEVVIRTTSKEIVFEDAVVSVTTVQGQKTYQIVGTARERERKSEENKADKGVPAEDVRLVMEQTGCSAAEAKKALDESDGAPAEAILKIMSSR